MYIGPTVRGAGQVPARDCSAPAGISAFGAGSVVSSLLRLIFLFVMWALATPCRADDVPSFSPSDGRLTLPGVSVDGARYDVELLLLDAQNYSFGLSRVAASARTGIATSPSFSFATSLLEIPLVRAGGVLAKATLALEPRTDPPRFRLTSSAILTANATGRPDALPSLDSLNLYSAASPLAQTIVKDPEVDPSSGRYVQGLLQSGGLSLLVKQWTFPVYLAGPETPRRDLPVYCGKAWELGVTKMKNVPIPDWAEPSADLEGGAAPAGCGEASGQDNPMVVLDLVNRCEIGFWQARKENGSWVASWANGNSMDGTGIFPFGLSGRGSGFSYLSGVIWPDELREGRIRHKLSFSYKFTKASGPVAPATDSDGVTEANYALPEGAVLQLDPNLDLDTLGLTAYEKTIARAMQEYGLILLDTGGTGLGLYAVDPRSVAGGDMYTGTLPDQPYLPLNIPLEKMRVLKLPEQRTDWRANLRLEQNACAQFE